MDSRKLGFSYVSALLLGFVAAFVVFAEVFADVSGSEAMALMPRLLAALAVYIGLGLVFGYIKPERSWEWGLQLGLPAMIILGFAGLMAVRNQAWAGLGVVVVLLAAVLVAGCLGGFIGARLAGALHPRGEIAG